MLQSKASRRLGILRGPLLVRLRSGCYSLAPWRCRNLLKPYKRIREEQSMRKLLISVSSWFSLRWHRSTVRRARSRTSRARSVLRANSNGDSSASTTRTCTDCPVWENEKGSAWLFEMGAQAEGTMKNWSFEICASCVERSMELPSSMLLQ